MTDQEEMTAGYTAYLLDQQIPVDATPSFKTGYGQAKWDAEHLHTGGGSD